MKRMREAWLRKNSVFHRGPCFEAEVANRPATAHTGC